MVTDQRLLQTQKNQVFDIIKRWGGTNPARFEWEDEISSDNSRMTSKLVRKSSKFFYRFGVTNSGYYKCERCPGGKLPREYVVRKDWSEVAPDFIEWAVKVKKELEAPDPWAVAQKYASSFPVSFDDISQDETFTQEESQQIISAIKEVEKRIVGELGFVDHEIAYVRSRLSYLESRAIPGYYKVDWMNLLMSTLINVAVTLSLDPAKAHQIWLFFKTALSPVIKFIGG
jgi:hypothetical protein